MAAERYIPAARWRRLSPIYDATIALTMREQRWRRTLIDEVLDEHPQEILDLGCGTGTLAVQLARRAAESRVIGLDGDPEILKRAADKARAAGVELQLLEALADAIPLEDLSVDCIVSSLVFHHLSHAAKQRALAEARRVLRPNGRLVIADWGRPQDPLMRVAFLAVQLLDGFENTRLHAAGELPDLIRTAGFDVRPIARLRTIWGTLELLTATPIETPTQGDSMAIATQATPS